jgi:carbamoyl-phosphate synthase large subunit
MPKRTDIKSILIIGAGPIIIGQACEFDYSGVQACKALREEGYKVILINSNPATIMTDPATADVTYIEPITWQTVEKIIARERPDAILPTMGGADRAELRAGSLAPRRAGQVPGRTHRRHTRSHRQGRRPPEVQGRDDQDRPGFRAFGHCHSMEEAWGVQKVVGFPTVIRPSFTLGGTGGGIAYNAEEFETICKRGLEASPTNELLIEESLLGWKEYEMEVVRDKADNCIIICSIENLDPMGVHTGDLHHRRTGPDADRQGIPDHAQCLAGGATRDRGRYRRLQCAVLDQSEGRPHGRHRDEPAGLALLRAGLQGDRLSRSPRWRPSWRSATPWTNCATRSPAVPRQPRSSPASTTSSPRFRASRLKNSRPPIQRLTTQMKSVGEVMAMGRTFQESFQKALRGLEVGVDGMNEKTQDRESPGEGTRRARPRPHLVRGGRLCRRDGRSTKSTT